VVTKRLFEEEFGQVRLRRVAGALFWGQREKRAKHFVRLLCHAATQKFWREFKGCLSNGNIRFWILKAGPRFPRRQPAALIDPNAL